MDAGADGRAEAGPNAPRAEGDAISLAFVAALQLLPPRERAAVVLTDALDFSISEVAWILDTTEKSVTADVAHARALLANHGFDRAT